MRVLLLCLVLMVLPAAAEQSVSQGDYVVHYAAINSQSLTPEIAARYGVTRAADQALLVINAQQRKGPGPARAVRASAGGSMRDLVQEPRPLRFRGVTEDGIETLIAPFRFDDLQVLSFDVKVLPAGASAPLLVRFKQQFYRDE